MDRMRSRGPWLLAGILLLPWQASAQSGQLVGVVTDSAGRPLAGADVSILALRKATVTDTNGMFSIRDLHAGEIELSVRRLGYEPRKVPTVITEVMRDSLNVVLVAQAALLEGIDVSARQMRLRKSIEEFYRRAARGVGRYITRDDINARHPLTSADLFRSIPGIAVVHVQGTEGVRFNTTSVVRNCRPMIWLDGQRAPGMEIGDVPVMDVEGIELYNGPATAPMQFSQGPTTSACGVILVWSRPPPPAKRGS